MTSPTDPLLNDLRELPEVPIDAAMAEDVRRRARDALTGAAEARPALGRLSLAWTGAILPGVLLLSGAAYTWGAVQMIGRIYLGA